MFISVFVFSGRSFSGCVFSDYIRYPFQTLSCYTISFAVIVVIVVAVVSTVVATVNNVVTSVVTVIVMVRVVASVVVIIAVKTPLHRLETRSHMSLGTR